MIGDSRELTAVVKASKVALEALKVKVRRGECREVLSRRVGGEAGGEDGFAVVAKKAEQAEVGRVPRPKDGAVAAREVGRAVAGGGKGNACVGEADRAGDGNDKGGRSGDRWGADTDAAEGRRTVKLGNGVWGKRWCSWCRRAVGGGSRRVHVHARVPGSVGIIGMRIGGVSIGRSRRSRRRRKREEVGEEGNRVGVNGIGERGRPGSRRGRAGEGGVFVEVGVEEMVDGGASTETEERSSSVEVGYTSV